MTNEKKKAFHKSYYLVFVFTVVWFSVCLLVWSCFVERLIGNGTLGFVHM